MLQIETDFIETDIETDFIETDVETDIVVSLFVALFLMGRLLFGFVFSFGSSSNITNTRASNSFPLRFAKSAPCWFSSNSNPATQTSSDSMTTEIWQVECQSYNIVSQQWTSCYLGSFILILNQLEQSNRTEWIENPLNCRSIELSLPYRTQLRISGYLKEHHNLHIVRKDAFYPSILCIRFCRAAGSCFVVFHPPSFLRFESEFQTSMSVSRCDLAISATTASGWVCLPTAHLRGSLHPHDVLPSHHSGRQPRGSKTLF